MSKKYKVYNGDTFLGHYYGTSAKQAIQKGMKKYKNYFREKSDICTARKIGEKMSYAYSVEEL